MIAGSSDDEAAVFTVLGSASGMPHPERACSGYVLRVGESLSVIDCGGGVSSAFVRFGFDPLKADRVFISHSHADHVSDLPLFIQMIYLTRRENRLDIYLPEEYVVPFQITMRSMYLIPERFSFPFHVHAYKAGPVFDGPFSLTAIANNHLIHHEDALSRLGLANKMQCYSFRVDVDRKSLLYTSDIDGIDDIREHVGGCDYVVLELTHVDLDEFLAFAPNAEVGKFVVAHLGDDDAVKQIEQAAAKAGLTNLVLATDGMEIRL
jgi:ribonuclease BN (tRNA processing enzyme)